MRVIKAVNQKAPGFDQWCPLQNTGNQLMDATGESLVDGTNVNFHRRVFFGILVLMS